MFQKIKLFMVLILSFSGFSQDLNKDIELIADKMISSNSIQMEVDVNVFSSKGGKMIFTTEAKLFKRKDDFKSILSDVEIVKTSGYFVKLDHTERMILVQKKNTKILKEQDLNIDVEALKRMLGRKDEVRDEIKTSLVSNKSGVKTYSIKGIQGVYEMIIVLDSVNSKLIKVSYQYGTKSSKGQYAEMKYTKFLYNQNLSNEFDLSQYFTGSNKNYVLNPKLKGFKLFTEE